MPLKLGTPKCALVYLIFSISVTEEAVSTKGNTLIFFLNKYVSFFNSFHCHEKEQDDDRDTRGLSCEQKVIINKAFSRKIQSTRDINHFFRAERIASRGTDCEESFPKDPPEGKLKNYIQAYRRSNSVTYNPSLGVFNVFSSLLSTVLGPFFSRHSIRSPKEGLYVTELDLL
jgi:hypothetical protein